MNLIFPRSPAGVEYKVNTDLNKDGISCKCEVLDKRSLVFWINNYISYVNPLILEHREKMCYYSSWRGFKEFFRYEYIFLLFYFLLITFNIFI